MPTQFTEDEIESFMRAAQDRMQHRTVPADFWNGVGALNHVMNGTSEEGAEMRDRIRVGTFIDSLGLSRKLTFRHGEVVLEWPNAVGAQVLRELQANEEIRVRLGYDVRMRTGIDIKSPPTGEWQLGISGRERKLQALDLRAEFLEFPSDDAESLASLLGLKPELVHAGLNQVNEAVWQHMKHAGADVRTCRQVLSFAAALGTSPLLTTAGNSVVYIGPKSQWSAYALIGSQALGKLCGQPEFYEQLLNGVQKRWAERRARGTDLIDENSKFLADGAVETRTPLTYDTVIEGKTAEMWAWTKTNLHMDIRHRFGEGVSPHYVDRI